MKKKITTLFIFYMALYSSFISHAQNGYKVGQIIQNFSAPVVLNYGTTTTSFNALKKKLTILDFFGTWCVPCRRALPGLSELQKKYSDALSVVLLSTEEETKLKSFLERQPAVTFPVVVDKGEKITSLFQPPSLPYTVVINEEGQVVAITEAGEINDAKMQEWLSAKPVMIKDQVTIRKEIPQQKNDVMTFSNNATIKLSQEFIYAAKTGDGTDALVEQFKKLDYTILKNSLQTDADKKAFWINIYNGYTQILLKANPDQYKKRSSFFGTKQINIAGKLFSLDEIEHGFLRHSKIKWSLGHFNKFFPGTTEKELRVVKVDYRIHFALNCGAKSCPPIAYYSPEKLEVQLELATKNYLTSEASYVVEESKIYLPALMGWFRGDFGGKKGMKKMLKKQGILPQEASPKIKFKKYDWSLYLANYNV